MSGFFHLLVVDNGQTLTIATELTVVAQALDYPLLLVCKFCKFSTREDRGVKEKLRGVKEKLKLQSRPFLGSAHVVRTQATRKFCTESGY